MPGRRRPQLNACISAFEVFTQDYARGTRELSGTICDFGKLHKREADLFRDRDQDFTSSSCHFSTQADTQVQYCPSLSDNKRTLNPPETIFVVAR